MKRLLFVLPFLLILTAIIIGCGDTENPLEPIDLTENTATGVFAETKQIKTVPAAPAAPRTLPPGTPFIKEVGYYSDWQLTEPITESVAVGTQVFIKIVFSEPMKHVVSDDEKARPILYHRRVGQEEELVRFKMAAHGASGEDFITGDAKPFQVGTDDYVCKYRVVAEDAGKEVAIMVGKWSVDMEGNTLAAFYTHPVKLQVKPTATAPVQPEQPEQRSDPTPEPTAPESAETTPLMIVSIAHYRDGSDIPIAEGERVPAGTTLLTEIVFSEAVKVDNTLRITYTTSKGEKRYGTSQSGVHWRGTCQPGKRQNSVLCKADASVDPFIVRVQTASDLDGNTLGEPVTASEVDVDTIHLSNNRIDENQPIGSVVGTFRVPVGKRVTYSVVAGTEDFSVAAGTKLVSNKVFNHEVQWTYQITVRETDRETNESLEKSYTLFINDVNEAPTDLRLTSNTFYREDGIGTKIGQLVITDEDRKDEHHVSITQGSEYVAYDNGYLNVLKRFDQATKEIAVEVTDKAGLTYTETFEISMQERPTAPSGAGEPTPPSQDDETSDDSEDTQPTQGSECRWTVYDREGNILYDEIFRDLDDPFKDSDGDGVPNDHDDQPCDPFRW